MKNSAVQTISELHKGIFGVTVITETTPSMRKTNNPYIGRVVKRTTYTNAILGVDYTNCVNNRLDRKGEVADYVSAKPTGKHWYNAFFYVSDKDEEKFYLKIGFYSHVTHPTSEYIIDGRIATADEVKEVRSFEYAKPDCKKQTEAGLSGEEQYKIVAPLLANVVSVKIGERVITD